MSSQYRSCSMPPFQFEKNMWDDSYHSIWGRIIRQSVNASPHSDDHFRVVSACSSWWRMQHCRQVCHKPTVVVETQKWPILAGAGALTIASTLLLVGWRPWVSILFPRHSIESWWNFGLLCHIILYTHHSMIMCSSIVGLSRGSSCTIQRLTVTL